MRTIAILVCAVGALVSGCVSIKAVPLAPDSATAMAGQTIASTTRVKPDFLAMTPAKAQLGITGAFLMIGVGNAIVRDNNIEDPSAGISADLAQVLAAKTGATVAAAPASVTGDTPQAIAANAGDARFVIDVATSGFGYMYQPTQWDLYNVTYGARLRIVDTSTKTIVGDGICIWKPAKGAALPTSKELLANGAAEVKSQLAQARAFCTTQFKQQILGIL